jgi:hypothetical protein
MNDSSDIAQVLRTAQKAVDDASIEDPELKKIAFKEAIALAAGRASGDSSQQSGGGSQSGHQVGIDSGNPIAAIAKRLGLASEDVDRIFHIDAEELELTVPVSALSNQKRTATREIAILVTAGRQAASLDQRETDADVVRAVCDHYKKLDTANYSATIRDLNGTLTVREKGRKKFLKMTQPAWEEASGLARKVLGQAD